MTPIIKPRAGAGIAEFERALRLVKSARSAAFDFPDVPVLCRRSPECGDGARRIDNVLGLQQTADTGRSGRQRPENQRPVRDRLVARHAKPTPERRRTHCRQRFRVRSFQKSQSRAAPGAESPVRRGQSSAIEAPAARLCQRHPAVGVKVASTPAGEGTLFRFDRPHSVWQTGSLILRIIRGSI